MKHLHPSFFQKMINYFDKYLAKIEDFLTAFSAFAIFFLMITATIQIVSRKILNLPIPGYIDFAEQSIAIFAFISIAYCQRLGGHVRMEIFLSASYGSSRNQQLADHLREHGDQRLNLLLGEGPPSGLSQRMRTH